MLRLGTEQTIQFPCKAASKCVTGDYDALKCLVDEVITNQQLAKTMSIHNFTALATIGKPSLIYCLWPNRLLKYCEMLRKLCYFTDSGDDRENPINLLTYSTNSAGFSLPAANKLMMRTKEEVEYGVNISRIGHRRGTPPCSVPSSLHSLS